MQDSAQKTNSPGNLVSTSPFNAVKLELGICLFLGALLWLAADSITADINKQLLIFAVFSVGSMAWLVMRTRRILNRLQGDAAQQNAERDAA